MQAKHPFPPVLVVIQLDPLAENSQAFTGVPMWSSSFGVEDVHVSNLDVGKEAAVVFWQIVVRIGGEGGEIHWSRGEAGGVGEYECEVPC